MNYMERKMLALVLRNQYRMSAVLSELLHAPGVTAHRQPGVSLHTAMQEVQQETIETLRDAGYGD